MKKLILFLTVIFFANFSFASWPLENTSGVDFLIKEFVNLHNNIYDYQTNIKEMKKEIILPDFPLYK